MKKNTPPSGGGHGEKSGNTGELIEKALERPEEVVNGDGKKVEALSDGVGATGKQITKIIETL